MKSVLAADNRGLLWAAMKPGEAIAKAHEYDQSARATVVQVTNLGISVKDSPQNVLILVTALDTGAPVAGANVSIRTVDNKVVWNGVTDANGLATSDVKGLRSSERSWEVISKLHFIVVAEKDGDIAYVGSDWNEGVQPWDFGVPFDLGEARPLLRGTIFTDRGVYKLGEEVHFKVIVRSDTPSGMELLTSGTKIEVALHDAHAKEIDKRTIALNEWSSAEWTFKLPSDAPLGTYSATAKVAGQRLNIAGEFLVAAYRRPDFRVDTTLTAPTSLAGIQLDGKISGRYLHGGAMAGRAVTWTYSKIELLDVPEAIRERFPEERYSFLGWDWENRLPARSTISTKDETLDSNGELSLKLDTDLKAGWPLEYRLEGD